MVLLRNGKSNRNYDFLFSKKHVQFYNWANNWKVEIKLILAILTPVDISFQNLVNNKRNKKILGYNFVAMNLFEKCWPFRFLRKQSPEKCRRRKYFGNSWRSILSSIFHLLQKKAPGGSISQIFEKKEHCLYETKSTSVDVSIPTLAKFGESCWQKNHLGTKF